MTEPTPQTRASSVPREHRDDHQSSGLRAVNGRRKRAETRRRLLQAAFGLLGTPDGRNVQIADIVKHARLAHGTFYNYFDSRTDLLNVMAYQLNQGLDAAVAEAPDPVTRTTWAVRAYIHKAEADRAWGWAMINLSGNGLQALGADTYRNACETVADGMATRQFRLPSQQSGIDLIIGTALQAIQAVCEGRAGATHADDAALVILLGLGVARSHAERLVRTPLPDMEIGHPGLRLRPA